MVQNSKKKSSRPERSSRRLRGLSPEIKDSMFRTPPSKGASKTSTPRNLPPLTRAPKQGEKDQRHPLDFAAFAETSQIQHPFPQLPSSVPQAAGVNSAEMSKQGEPNTTRVMDRSRPPAPFTASGGHNVPQDQQQPPPPGAQGGAIPKKTAQGRPEFHTVQKLAKIKRDLEDFAIAFGRSCEQFKLALAGRADYHDITAMTANLRRMDKEYKALFETTFGQMHEYPDVQKIVRLDYDRNRNAWKALKSIYKNIRVTMAPPSQLSGPSTTVASSIASTKVGILTAVDLAKESIRIVELRYAAFLQGINYQLHMPSTKWQYYLDEVDKFGQNLWDLFKYYEPSLVSQEDKAAVEHLLTQARTRIYTQRQPILDMFTQAQQAEIQAAAAIQQARVEHEQRMMQESFHPQVQQQQLLQTVRSYFEQPLQPQQAHMEINPEDSVSQANGLGGHIDPQVDLSRPPPIQQLSHFQGAQVPLPGVTGTSRFPPGAAGASRFPNVRPAEHVQTRGDGMPLLDAQTRGEGGTLQSQSRSASTVSSSDANYPRKLVKGMSIEAMLKSAGPASMSWDDIFNMTNEHLFFDPTLKPATKLEVSDLFKFSGDPVTAWPQFKERINSAINLKRNLDWPQKQEVLLKSVTGYARRLIEDYPFSRYGYAQCLFTLHCEFNDFNKHKDLLMERIKAMKPIDKHDETTLRNAKVDLRKIVMYAHRSGSPAAEVWATAALSVVPMNPPTMENWLNFLDRHDDSNVNIDLFDKWVDKKLKRIRFNVARNHVVKEQKQPTLRFNAAPVLATNILQEIPEQGETEDDDKLTTEDQEEVLVPQQEATEALVVGTERFCTFCNMDNHDLPFCNKFKAKKVAERKQHVVNEGLCFVCLKAEHKASDCNDAKPCARCGAKDHHTVIHVAQNAPSNINEQVTKDLAIMKEMLQDLMKEKSVHNLVAAQSQISSLPTYYRVLPLQISLSPDFTNASNIYAVLDECARSTFISESLAEKLGCDMSNKESQLIQFLGVAVKMDNVRVPKLYIRKPEAQEAHEISAFTVPYIPKTIRHPDYKTLKKKFHSLRTVNFLEHQGVPNKVDLLIGVDNYELQVAISELPFVKGQPYARETPLGWTVTLPSQDVLEDQVVNFVNNEALPFNYTFPDTQMDKLLESFYTLENAHLASTDRTKALLESERQALRILEDSISLENGAYTMRTPWKPGFPNFKCNREIVKIQQQRHVATLKKKDPDIIVSVRSQFANYANKSWIQLVPPEDSVSRAGYWLAWFVVTVLTKTTPHRIVFDCARKFFGLCLNDGILPGPKTQTDIFDILLRFRLNDVAVTADISKMYMNFKLHPDDRPFHSFFDVDGNEWQFVSWPFGINASPFACIFTMLHHINVQGNKELMEFAKKSFYVDDMLSSFHTEKEAVDRVKNLREVLIKASLPLEKILSNSQEVMDSFPEESRAKEFTLSNPDLFTSTLGLRWFPKQDHFSFQGWTVDETPLTKRKMAKIVASIFDPQGFISPFTVVGAKLLQNVCKFGRTVPITWDTVLVPELHEGLSDLVKQWNKFTAELQLLPQITIPRQLRTTQNHFDLFIFSDGSEMAYASVVYLVTTGSDGTSAVTSRLVCSNKRLAPISGRTIPELELLGATISSRLAKHLNAVLKPRHIYLWVDSKCILHWILHPVQKMKEFTRNRVVEIRENLRNLPTTWRFVPTDLNPADLPTRGLSVTKLKDCQLWLKGPEFILQHKDHWPEKLSIFRGEDIFPTDHEILAVQDLCRTHYVRRDQMGHYDVKNYTIDPQQLSKAKEALSWLEQTSGLFNMNKVQTISRMINVIKYCLSWTKTFRDQDALKLARVLLFKTAQAEDFKDELLYFVKNKDWPPHGSLKNHPVHFDENGLLRYYGRWAKDATRPQHERHPLVISNKSRLAVLTLEEVHRACGHGSSFAVLTYELQKRIFVFGSAALVKQLLRTCCRCQRFSRRPAKQWLAPPSHAPLQVDHVIPFSQISLDFCGPFTIVHGRSCHKRYVLVVACQQSKAIFVEDAQSLSTDDFLLAFDVFVSEKGKPDSVRSDNAKCFTSARDMLYFQECQQAVDLLRGHLVPEQISGYMAKKSIDDWTLSIPVTPHTNGLAERFVGLFKTALLKVTQAEKFSAQAFRKLIKNAQNIVNSRPLVHSSHQSLEDSILLTPNHFQRAKIHAELVPKMDSVTSENLIKKFIATDIIIDEFWQRYTQLTLQQSQKQVKWTSDPKTVREGDLAFLIDKKQKRNNWPLVRITKAIPDSDGLVRRVAFDMFAGANLQPDGKLTKIKKVNLQRHINALIPLETLCLPTTVQKHSTEK